MIKRSILFLIILFTASQASACPNLSGQVSSCQFSTKNIPLALSMFTSLIDLSALDDLEIKVDKVKSKHFFNFLDMRFSESDKNIPMDLSSLGVENFKVVINHIQCHSQDVAFNTSISEESLFSFLEVAGTLKIKAMSKSYLINFNTNLGEVDITCNRN